MVERKVKSQNGSPQKVENQLDVLCVQVACDMSLKNSRRGLQLCFIPHLDRRSAQEVIVLQSRGSSNLSDFGTLILESWDKKSFG
jgi:hypothetical protein